MKGLAWLEKEIKKDEIEVEQHKEVLIQEILSINKEEMFKKEVVVKKKLTFFEKLKIALGYGTKH
jgi:hypothetical protein